MHTNKLKWSLVCHLYQVALSAVNIIGTPAMAPAAASARSIKTALDGDGVLSEYDDISFLMYTDKEVTKALMVVMVLSLNIHSWFNVDLWKVAQIISKLEKKKLEAVSTERFEYAKKIKAAIG